MLGASLARYTGASPLYTCFKAVSVDLTLYAMWTNLNCTPLEASNTSHCNDCSNEGAHVYFVYYNTVCAMIAITTQCVL